MKVLLIGATGNLGIRLVAALLTHGHTVTAYVRSSSKLESLLPPSVYSQITVIQGDAKNSASIKRAVLDSNCEAVVNSAGVAAMAPWGKSDLPEIFRAVFDGVREAGQEKGGRPLRVWFLGGQSVMMVPGTQKMMMDCVPIFLEHRHNLALLKSLPPNTIDWSMLCPQTMTPESPDVNVPLTSKHGKLVASATVSPMWQDSWVKYIPLIGNSLWVAINASRYVTTLEQNADFIASDLESYESQWSCVPVGIIDPSK